MQAQCVVRFCNKNARLSLTEGITLDLDYSHCCLTIFTDFSHMKITSTLVQMPIFVTAVDSTLWNGLFSVNEYGVISFQQL